MNRKLKKITNQKEKLQKKVHVYFMQSVALSNYSKLCIKLKEPPKKDVIEFLSDCQDVKKLIESNKIFTSHLN